jgi:DNA-binding phage protein
MSAFKTSAEQQLKVYEIATAMKVAKLSAKFITDSVKLAFEYEGAHDLMVLWSEADDQKEKDEITADLQDEIDTHQELPKKPTKKPYIKFDDLDAIAKNIEGFKKNLRRVVDRHGGIVELAKKTGIPQPSLSRFFNSQSMPRRTTLYKIADALGLSENEIITDWVA